MRIPYKTDEELQELTNSYGANGYVVEKVEILLEGKFVTFVRYEPLRLPLEEQVAALKEENAMLQMSMMEMTMYAASQDERLQTQENAVMELSMIIAGGGL